MEFFRGDQIEVCSKEEGFLGSYYKATILEQLGPNNSYLVQYKDLLEEDEVNLLVEKVAADEVRPVPPRIRSGSGYRLFDNVDAFDNDGWWVGKITGTKGCSIYYVYFDTTKDEIAYHVSRLRPHLDWYDGKWVSSKKLFS